MTDGKRSTVKLNWEEFRIWQRWDEFPELSDNPPLTVEVMLICEGIEYYIFGDYGEYHFYSSDWVAMCSNSNLLSLLTAPIDLFNNRSFEAAIDDIGFVM